MANRHRSRASRGVQHQTLHAVQSSVAAREDNNLAEAQHRGSQMTEKLTGAALEKRRRAIAANAVQEDRRANGVADRPLTDHEAGIQEMLYTLLTKLTATETESDKETSNRMVPTHQPPTNPALINIEKLLSEIQDDAA